MAKLRGGVQGNRGPATRLSHNTINVWANTWEAIIDVDLWADGQYCIDIRPYKRGGQSRVIMGNAHEDIKPLPPVKPKKPRVRRPKPEPVCVLE